MIRNLFNKQIASLVVAVFSAATLYAQSSVLQTHFSGTQDSFLTSQFNYSGPQTDRTGEYPVVHAIGGGKVTFTFDDNTIFDSDTKPEQIISILAKCDGKSKTIESQNGTYSVSFDISHPESIKDVDLTLEATIKTTADSEETTLQYSFNSLKVYPLPTASFTSPQNLNIAENEEMDFSISIPSISGATDNWQYECTEKPNFAHFTIYDNSLSIAGTSPNVDGDVKKIDEYGFNIRYYCVDPVNNDASYPWLSGLSNVASLYVYNKPAATPTLNVYHLGDDIWSIAANMGMNDIELKEKEYQFAFNGQDNRPELYRCYDNYAQSVCSVWVYRENGTEFRTESATVNVSTEYTISNSFTYELEKGSSQPTTYQPVLIDQTWHGWTNDIVRFNYQANQDGLLKLSAKFFVGNTEVENGSVITSLSGHSAHVDFLAQIPLEINYPMTVGFSSNNIENAFQIYSPAVVPTATSFGNRKAFDNAVAELNYSATEGSGSSGNWNYSWTRKKTSDGSTSENQLRETGTSLIRDNDIAIAGEKKTTDNYEYILHYVNFAPDRSTVWAEGDLNMGSLTVYNVPAAPSNLKLYKIGEQNVYVTNFNTPESNYDGYGFVYDSTSRTDAIQNEPYIESASGIHAAYLSWTYPDNTIANSQLKEINGASDTYTANTQIKINGVTFTGATNGWNFTGAQKYQNEWYGLANSDIQLSQEVSSLGSATSASTVYLNGAQANENQQKHIAAAGNYAYTLSTVYTIPLNNGSSFVSDPLVAEAEKLTLYDVPTVPSTINYTGSLQRTESAAPALRLNIDYPTGGKSDGWLTQWDINGTNINGENSSTYTDAIKREVSGYSKKIDEYYFSLSYANVGPDGSNWISGNVNLATPLKVYNEPYAINNVTGYQTDSSNFQFIACNIGLTDEQLAEADYVFEYNNGSIGNSRYMPENINPSEMWTKFVYDDGFTTSSARTAADTQLKSPSVKLTASADGSGLAAPIVNGVATDNNGFHYCLPGSRISLSTTASLENADFVSSAYSVNGVSFDGAYTVPESNVEADGLFRDLMTFNIKVDNGVKKSLTFNSGDFTLARFYPAPSIPSTVSYTGNLQRSESFAPAIGLSVEKPAGANAGEWNLQWTINDVTIDGATNNTYTDNELRSVSGTSKKIDEYQFAILYTNSAPNGYVWVSGETKLANPLKIYNEPNAIGRVVGYQTAESEFMYIAQDLGLSDEHLSEYDFYYDGTKNAEGRYLPKNVSPTTMWTQFVYDDGFTTSSERTTVDSQLKSPSVKLTASADGTGLAAPIVNGVATDNNGFHHCLPGSRLTLSTTASLENANFTSSAYSVNGVAIESAYTVPESNVETNAIFRDLMTFNIVVDKENGTNSLRELTFQSPEFNLAKFYPTPVYPSLESYAGNLQYRDIDPTDYILTTSAPNGANASGWKLQWTRDNAELAGQTSSQYHDNNVYDIPENTKIKKDVKFELKYANAAPVGNTNWIEGNLTVPSLSIYNTPNKPERLVSIKFGDKYETIATGIGLTDDEAAQKEYLFSFNGETPVQSRFLTGDASKIATVWNYADFVCSSDETERTADGISEITFSDLTTSTSRFTSGVITDNETYTATYSGPVLDSANSIYYGISGYDRINNSAIVNITNEAVNGITHTTKTILSKDGNQIDSTDGLSYSSSELASGVYTFENIVEPLVKVENNQLNGLAYSVSGTHSINILEAPVFPTPKANADSYFFDDTDVINLNASIDPASNANSAGWSTKWIVDDREVGQNEELRYPINNDNKAVATHNVTFSFVNKAPVGDTNWIEGENTSFPPIVVFNVPEQPAGLGHFFDEGSQTDSYFAMNAGLSDNLLSARQYQFCFNDGNGEIIKSVSDGRYFDAKVENKRPSTVSAVWVYSTANGDSYDYTTKARSAVNSTDEYSFAYDPKLNISRGNNTDAAMFPVTEVTADGLRQALSGVSLTYTPNAVETSGKTLSNFVVKTKLSTGSSISDFGGDEFTVPASAAGLYSLEQNVSADIAVDTDQLYSVSGADTSCDKVQIWDCPVIETPAIVNLGQWRDIDMPDLGNNGLAINQPEGGNSHGWQYAWSRSDIGIIGNDPVLAKDDNSVNDESEEKHSMDYTYSVKYTNLAPDEETVWYTRSVDIAKATVYNTPRQPGSFVYFNSNGSGDDKYIVKNLGLSDQQIDNLDYKFVDDSGVTLSRGSRYIISGSQLSSIRSFWNYSDGYNAYSDATPIETAELMATFAPDVKVEKGSNSSEAYKGAVSDNQGMFHSLQGSDIEFGVELQNSNLDLAATALKVSDSKGNESVVTPTINGNKAEFSYRMADVATYSIYGDINSRYLVDNYSDGNGMNPVYADLKSRANLSQFSVRTYPTPILSVAAETTGSDYKYRSIDTDIAQLSVTSASGGNESWNYIWLKDNVATGTQGTAADVVKESFTGNGKEMKSAKYSVRVTDANPVNGEPWYDYTFDVSTISFYNTPNKATKLINYVNNGRNIAFASGLGLNDAELNSLEYELIFDNTNNGSRRSIAGKASEVRSTWKYNDGFVCSSEPTAATETIEPQITASVNITDANYSGYSGAVKDSGENERYYALPGAVGQYSFNITGKDLSVKDNAVSFKLENGNMPAQSQQYRTEFNNEGVYDGVVSATMLYNAESNQTIDLLAEFGLPTSALVEILPAPVYPVIGSYNNQFRDIDAEFILEPQSLPSGANYDGWTYSWAEGSNIYGNDASATIGIDDMNADQMQAIKRNITMQYSNSAPNGQEWITGSLDFETYIYNTPRQPATLTRKGNGTSNIYIVTDMDDTDESLKAKHYQFAFGDGSNPSPEASKVVDIEGRRWYKYENSPTDPWVYSLWKYSAANGIPAYDCYSDVTRIGDGSRSDISLRDLYGVDDEEITIFNAGGVRIDLDQTKKLSPGVYVVVHGSGDDTYSEKIVVK